MKNLLNKLPKKLLTFIAVLIATVGIGSVAVANFGPDRPIREWTPAENGFDYVTFNSYKNVPVEDGSVIADERNFLEGVVKGRDSQWTDPVNDIRNNDTITAKIYIHNNANPKLNDAPGKPGVARDVNVRVDIPEGLSIEHEVKSYISASNAQPKTVYDTLDLNSINGSLMELDYVPGSAKITKGGSGSLSDSIFTEGGVDLDDHYGCTEFVREITFEMKVSKPGYRIQKTARLEGEGKDDWRKVVNAERGDTIEWRIWFENIGSTRLEDVKLVDDLPSYVDVVPGSIERDAVITNQQGQQELRTYRYGENAIQGDQVNINMFDYAPGSDTFVYLSTTIQDHEDIKCGNFQIANVAYVTPEGLGTLNDNAKVNIINEECEEPEPVTACTNLSAANLTLVEGESTKFTADSSTNGPALLGYIFEVNGEEVQNSESNMYTFTAEEAGQYTIRATAKFENGNKTSDACVKTVTVVEQTEPVYTCDDLTAKLVKDWTFTFTTDTTARNGATVKDYTYDFGDGSDELLTDKNVVEHSYKKAGSYTATVTVRFDVNGEVKTAGSENCKVKITISDNEEPEVEGETTTKPTTLPNTGAGSIAGAFAAITAAGAAGHSLVLRRRK